MLNRLMHCDRFVISAGLVIAIVFITGVEQPARGEEGAGEYQMELFKKEMDLAEKAEDRDSKIAHLRKAMSYRPGLPDNIAIEYKIAQELSYNVYPKFPEQVPQPKEALKVYEKILRDYDHMAYHKAYPFDDGRVRSKRLLVPRAAIAAAYMEIYEFRRPLKAREHSIFAMRSMMQTNKKRLAAWEKELPPPKFPKESQEVLERLGYGDQWEQQMQRWRARQEAVAEGNVLTEEEKGLVKGAVKVFGLSFGRVRPREVAPIMHRLIEMFPDTPISKEAQRHIDRAAKLAEKVENEEFDRKVEGLQLDLTPEVTTAPASMPDTAPTAAPQDSETVVPPTTQLHLPADR